MRELFVLLLALSVTSGDMFAAGRGRVRVRPDAGLTLTFVTIESSTDSYAIVDAGRVSYATHGESSTRGIRMTQRVGVRGTDPGSRTRFASLRARLEVADPGLRVFVDGVELGAAPVLIHARMPLGATITRKIEILVPARAPEGAVGVSIGWELTAD